ncbi:hypothetical protein [uncultured Microscilla sp.]|uniref:hypothetical protein n=1 Tax=uncultured Microscilla sp. TaxID=432653 RepID=UPI0026399E59|nr:hypothetical protein [uncultured Microscilla sp.]
MKAKQLLPVYLLCITLWFTGCEHKASLQSTYNEKNLEADLLAIEKTKQASKEDLKLLSVYILYNKIIDQQIGSETYADLLLAAKTTKRKKIKPFQVIFSRLERAEYDEVLGNALAISAADSSLHNKRKEFKKLDENFAREQDKILREMEANKKSESEKRREFSNNLEEENLGMPVKVAEKTRKALKVTLIEKKVAKKTESYAYVLYTFELKNTTSKKMKALTGKVDVLDNNIDLVTSVLIECNQEVDAAQAIQWKYEVRYPVLSQVYKKLKDLPKPQVVWNPQKIFFADGTIWQ